MLATSFFPTIIMEKNYKFGAMQKYQMKIFYAFYPPEEKLKFSQLIIDHSLPEKEKIQETKKDYSYATFRDE